MNLHYQKSPPGPTQSDPQPRRWTRAEYYQMGEMGLFNGQRVELIGGEIMVMSPQKIQHYKSADGTGDVLKKAYGKGYWVRVQAPVDLGMPSEPEPDVSVVEGKPEDYTAHPKKALLAVEVSETTLAYDRGEKASLYAAGGLKNYWIVNLVDDQLEVFTKPIPDSSKPFGYTYASRQIFRKKDVVFLPGLPRKKVAVARFFPR